MYWACRRVINVCYGHWAKYYPIVKELQHILETNAEQQLDELELRNTSLDNLVKWSNLNTHSVINKWWDMVDSLIMYWGDGYGTDPTQRSLGMLSGYSNEWLEAVGYFKMRTGVDVGDPKASK